MSFRGNSANFVQEGEEPRKQRGMIGNSVIVWFVLDQADRVSVIMFRVSIIENRIRPIFVQIGIKEAEADG